MNMNVSAKVSINTQLSAKMMDAVAGGLRIVGEIIMAQSKAECPVDTNALRSSGHVEPVIRRRKDLIVPLTYGGAAAGYAEQVHEDPKVRHTPPTKSKFLSDPVIKNAPLVYKTVARMIRSASSGTATTISTG